MASIVRHRAGWQAQIRLKGAKSLYRECATKEEARAWARGKEAELRAKRALGLQPKRLPKLTVADLLTRYLAEVTPTKRSAASETFAIGNLLKSPLAACRLDQITSSSVAQWRDERLQEVAPITKRLISQRTVQWQLQRLHHVFEVAHHEWGIPVDNPVTRKVTGRLRPNKRKRRLERDEGDRLTRALLACRNPLIEKVVRLAIETGMRRSEMLNMRWRDVDLEARELHIREGKTSGSARSIVLTARAGAILAALPAGGPSDRVFRYSRDGQLISLTERVAACLGPRRAPRGD